MCYLAACGYIYMYMPFLHVRSVYFKLSSIHLSILDSLTFLFAFDMDSKIISLNVLCVVDNLS